MADDHLTWYQRVQRRGRRHQRRATRDTALATVVAAALVALLSLQGAPPAPAVDADEGAVFSAAMVGDLLFGRYVEEVTDARGHDYPLAKAAGYFEAADYVTGNFEQAVLFDDEDSYELADKLIHLASGPEPVDALVRAGFTTIGLANNHTMDYGEAGLADTFAAFDRAGLETVGAGENREAAETILYQELGGLTVATLAFTDAFVPDFTAQAFRGGVLPADPELLFRLVGQASTNADLVVVHMHWGQEYDTSPHPRQVELAHALADAGADLVVGHHPHVLMPVEVYEGTVIFYSLGNFVFDQGWTRTRETAIARYILGGDGIARVEMVPMWIREAQPRPLRGLAAEYRRLRIQQALTGWGGGNTPLQRDGDVFAFEIDHSHVIGRAAAGNVSP